MIKNIFATALFIASSVFAYAETEVLRITFNNGNSQLINIADIRDMTFEDETPQSIAAPFAGVWKGTVKLTVGGAYTYSAEISVTVTANQSDGTISVNYPQYYLSGTMMGDLTLGAVTIDSLQWDEAKGGFYRSYGGQGIKQHFLAEKGGSVSMDNDYPLNDPSSILVTRSEDGKLKIENPFKLGAMPLPLSSAFEGTK